MTFQSSYEGEGGQYRTYRSSAENLPTARVVDSYQQNISQVQNVRIKDKQKKISNLDNKYI